MAVDTPILFVVGGGGGGVKRLGGTKALLTREPTGEGSTAEPFEAARLNGDGSVARQ